MRAQDRHRFGTARSIFITMIPATREVSIFNREIAWAACPTAEEDPVARSG